MSHNEHPHNMGDSTTDSGNLAGNNQGGFGESMMPSHSMGTGGEMPPNQGYNTQGENIV